MASIRGALLLRRPNRSPKSRQRRPIQFAAIAALVAKNVTAIRRRLHYTRVWMRVYLPERLSSLLLQVADLSDNLATRISNSATSALTCAENKLRGPFDALAWLALPLFDSATCVLAVWFLRLLERVAWLVLPIVGVILICLDCAMQAVVQLKDFLVAVVCAMPELGEYALEAAKDLARWLLKLTLWSFAFAFAEVSVVGVLGPTVASWLLVLSMTLGLLVGMDVERINRVMPVDLLLRRRARRLALSAAWGIVTGGLTTSIIIAWCQVNHTEPSLILGTFTIASSSAAVIRWHYHLKRDRLEEIHLQWNSSAFAKDVATAVSETGTTSDSVSVSMPLSVNNSRYLGAIFAALLLEPNEWYCWLYVNQSLANWYRKRCHNAERL